MLAYGFIYHVKKHQRRNMVNVSDLNKEGIYKRTVTISRDKTDENGCMTVLAVATNMQEAAGDQLTDLGIGFDFTSSRGMLWVVVWSEFVFSRLPRLGETIEFYTWPGKKMHWFYPRRAYAFDENGEEIVHGSYLWMLMDPDTRKVTEDHGLLGELPALSVQGECKIPAMKAEFPAELANITARKVEESEVDHNRHLNNAHYLNWVADLAVECGFDMQDLKTLWINYKKEILPGDTVTLAYEKKEDLLFVSGAGKEEHFIAKLRFKTV